MKFEWELVTHRDDCETTHRAKVPGGWVLREQDYWGSSETVALVFIADPHHSWTIEND